MTVLADTHGLLRPEVIDLVRGSDLILHAGDVGDAEILDRLGGIAPVRAVRGNVDRGETLAQLPSTEICEMEGRTVYMLHILEELDLSPQAAGFAAVVYGHSHRPSIERRNGVLFLNPGSCGPRRFSLPVTAARLLVGASDQPLEAEIVPLV